MIPRNVIAFTVPKAALLPFEAAERNDGASFSMEPPSAAAWLDECRLKPCGPLELASQGFVAPLGDHAPVDADIPGLSLFHRSGDCVWITVGTEQKILPGSVINAELRKRLAEIEQQEGRKPGGSTRKRIKDEVITTLLPRALVKPTRTDAWIDLQRGLVVVDASSRKRAEAVVSELRHALGTFPALPVNCEVAPRGVLTAWVVEGPSYDMIGPDFQSLSLGDAAHLADATDHGGRVRIADQELAGEEIRSHLEAGKQVTRLRIVMDDALEVDVGEDMVLRRLRLLDGATEALESTDRDDIAAELAARFALASGLVGRLLDALAQAFQWSKAEG